MEYKLSSFTFDDKIERDDKHLAVMMINELRSACPYNATFSGGFTKKGKSFEGSLLIHFARGEFRANGKAPDMKKLMDDIHDQIFAQIKAWRDQRFEQKESFIEFEKKVK